MACSRRIENAVQRQRQELRIQVKYSLDLLHIATDAGKPVIAVEYTPGNTQAISYVKSQAAKDGLGAYIGHLDLNGIDYVDNNLSPSSRRPVPAAEPAMAAPPQRRPHLGVERATVIRARRLRPVPPQVTGLETETRAHLLPVTEAPAHRRLVPGVGAAAARAVEAPRPAPLIMARIRGITIPQRAVIMLGNSSSNTGTSGALTWSHNHTSNWHYQDQTATGGTSQVEDLQHNVHLTTHDFLVM